MIWSLLAICLCIFSEEGIIKFDKICTLLPLPCIIILVTDPSLYSSAFLGKAFVQEPKRKSMTGSVKRKDSHQSRYIPSLPQLKKLESKVMNVYHHLLEGPL